VRPARGKIGRHENNVTSSRFRIRNEVGGAHHVVVGGHLHFHHLGLLPIGALALYSSISLSSPTNLDVQLAIFRFQLLDATVPSSNLKFGGDPEPEEFIVTDD